MSVEENKQIARRGYEAFNEYFRTGNVDAFRAAFNALAAADFIDHNPTPGQAPGLEGVVQSFVMFRSAFPDAQVSVEDMVAEGDKVAARLTFRGTHRGEFMGLSPTGKQVSQGGMDLVRFAGGKAMERWGYCEDLSLLQQLGAIPAPAQRS